MTAAPSAGNEYGYSTEEYLRNIRRTVEIVRGLGFSVSDWSQPDQFDKGTGRKNMEWLVIALVLLCGGLGILLYHQNEKFLELRRQIDNNEHIITLAAKLTTQTGIPFQEAVDGINRVVHYSHKTTQRRIRYRR